MALELGQALSFFNTKSQVTAKIEEKLSELSTGGTIQPVVNTVSGVLADTVLDIDEFNWFNIVPDDDIDFVFRLEDQDEAKFDLVIQNADAGVEVNGYNIDSLEYDNVSFSVDSEASDPRSVSLSSDGTKMFVVDESTNRIFEYNLSTPFDIDTSTYSNNSSDLGFTVIDHVFSYDGLKLYVLSSSDDRVVQFSMTSPFDITSLSSDNKSFLVEEDPFVASVDINPNGTKLFVSGSDNDRVYEYDLSVPFDVSSASYNSVSFSVLGQAQVISSTTFSHDGTKLFLIEGQNEILYEYDLSQPFDLSTAAYNGVNYNGIGDQDGQPFDIYFGNKGEKLYVVGHSTRNIYQYTTGSIISQTSKAEITFPSSVQWESGSAPQLSEIDEKDWVRFETFDGGSSWLGYVVYQESVGFVGEITYTQPIVESFSNTENFVQLNVDEYNWFNIEPAGDVTAEFKVENQDEAKFDLVWTNVQLPEREVGFDIANASYDSLSFSFGSEDSIPAGLAFSTDGTKLFMLGRTNDSVYQYSLNTAFDISNVSYDSISFSVGSQEAFPTDIAFSTDGSKMFIIGGNSDSCYEYILSTPFDLSTASYNNIDFSVSSQDSSPTGILFNTDGTKMYILGRDTDSVYQYSLATGFDLSTTSYDNVNFSVSNEDISVRDIEISNDGKKFFLLGDNNDSIFQYDLLNAFDIDSVSYSNVSFSFASQETSLSSIVFSEDGNKLYATGFGNDTLYQYSTSTTIPAQPAELNLPGTVEWVTGSAPTFSAVGEKDWFRFQTNDGGSTWLGNVVGVESAQSSPNFATEEYVDDKITNWTSLSTRWDTEPTLDTTISEGDVYTYVLDGVTRYRLVPDPYTAENDAFYTTFSGGVLSDLITKRNDPL